MKKIVSVSRRSDIPACYLQWFIDCLKKGYALVKNPYSGLSFLVNLRHKGVHTLVLWSKNFAPFLEQRAAFRDYHLFFNFTLNHCPLLEPNIPPLEDRLAQAKLLTSLYGAEHLQWRFDPIILWDGGRQNNTKSFAKISRFMAQLGVSRCVFSFANYYEKVKRRARNFSFNFYIPNKEEKLNLAEKLVDIAGDWGIKMLACCDDELLELPGVDKSRCIDGYLLQQLKGEPCSKAKDGGQRKNCGCTESIDIGSYQQQPCYHGCIYCYANPAL